MDVKKTNTSKSLTQIAIMVRKHILGQLSKENQSCYLLRGRVHIKLGVRQVGRRYLGKGSYQRKSKVVTCTAEDRFTSR